MIDCIGNEVLRIRDDDDDDNWLLEKKRQTPPTTDCPNATPKHVMKSPGKGNQLH